MISIFINDFQIQSSKYVEYLQLQKNESISNLWNRIESNRFDMNTMNSITLLPTSNSILYFH